MRVPPTELVWSEARRLAGRTNCIVKLIVTRKGGRGYATEANAPVRRIVARYPLIELDTRCYADGVRLRWCRLRLAVQPALAGLKHLNRLEQVHARAEWTDSRIHDGLMCSGEGEVISATAANVFIVSGGRLRTPRLDRCGVAGVARGWIIARARRSMPVDECDITIADVDAADEVFLSNAVRGIVPVRAIGVRRYEIGPIARRLGYTLAKHGIGPAPDVFSR